MTEEPIGTVSSTLVFGEIVKLPSTTSASLNPTNKSIL